MKGKIKCGYCDRPNIDPKEPHETRGDQPICPDCLKEWNACFSKPVDPLQKSFDFALT